MELAEPTPRPHRRLTPRERGHLMKLTRSIMVSSGGASDAVARTVLLRGVQALRLGLSGDRLVDSVARQLGHGPRETLVGEYVDAA